jgi:hypothetical protein
MSHSSGETTTKILRHRTHAQPKRSRLDRLPEIGRPKSVKPPLLAPTTTLDWDDDPTLTPDPVPEPTVHQRPRSRTHAVPRMREETIPLTEVPTIDDSRWFTPAVVVGAILTTILSIAV